MDSEKLQKITAKIKDQYPDVGIRKIEVDEATGKSTFFVNPTNKVLATLSPDKAINLHGPAAVASTLRRDVIDRSVLDLIKKSVSEEDPHTLFQRAIKYYYEADYYGSHIDILTNLSSKGFENDIDDDKIKAFYDTWNFDVNFTQILDWIFFDFFRVGMVRTYKIIGKYEPGVSYMSPIPGMKKAKGDLIDMSERAARIHQKRLKNLEKKLKSLDGRKKDERDLKEELAAKKRVWSKGFMPVAYTVLNPLLVDIEGSLLFDKTKVTLKPSDELKKLLKKSGSELTDDEKTILKLLPADFKSGVTSGQGIVLDPLFVGAVDYRKQPYERYPKPRGVKVFDALEYKNSLREADLSTLDGITNYILKITVGNDEYPVTDATQLETVAQLFNTTSKSFDVVYNHTLNIEKIVSPEIEAILGQDKYKQVNEDISGGLAVTRALVDGVTDVKSSEASLIVKTVIEEIHYARRQVEQWIYTEYRNIANAMGFDRFPKVRWDNTVLRDIIMYMSTISQLVDRRMLSYETALEQLGFDYKNEFNNMEKELPMVLEGTLGILGSPFQQKGGGTLGPQKTQRAPTGTPSSGRPRGQVPKKKQPNTNPKSKTKVPNQSPSNQPGPSPQAAGISIKTLISNAAEIMNEEQFKEFLDGFLSELRNANSE
jgi:hypothetical protein